MFLMNNKLLDNDKALVARLESLMTEVRNNIYLPNYDFELVADNLSAAESIVVDLCGPIDFDGLFVWIRLADRLRSQQVCNAAGAEHAGTATVGVVQHRYRNFFFRQV